MSADTGALSRLILMSSGASAVAGLASSFNESAALRAQSSYDAKMYDASASVLDRQAQDAISRGETAASRYGSQVRGLQGSQRAATASQGVQVDTGTPGDIVQDTGRMGALDILTLRNNAALEAFGYDVQAGQARAAGRMASAQGKAGARQTLATGGLSFLRQMAAGAYAARSVQPNPRQIPVPLPFGGGVGMVKNPNYRKYR